ncbi:APA family basic amino acid/polyamine antiporter [Kineosphaera limosa]|uniref:Putative amino acid transporter n=1 Tax=Kineosphaera limosa NBRC 100340 TaxID=1184609 RepID=K6WTP3_9MICO|nr:APC family permease [Kineosphaera limosa]NYE01356.1 APA family basic amino acid/polyamine antiporter [Kineosphaera limosa]GAB95472.1 putative amino acid transporter [Kineosphaera limosa NBRC 100340]
MDTPSTERMQRRLGLRDAIVLGLGSMVGAGVFAAFGPAAAAAGSGAGLLAALSIAALVAWCNATSSAQLAAQYPDSGGAYVYGRERLGERWGFAAGWCFIVGKTASCAAMATTAAVYALGEGSPWLRVVSAIALLGLTWVLLRGITKTAQLTRVLLAVTLTILLGGLAAVLVASPLATDPLGAGVDPAGGLVGGPVYGVLQAAGLLFFAFAGYARLATLGEEVRDPARVIPAAITRALALVVLLYAVLAVGLLVAVGPTALATSALPLADAATAHGLGPVAVLVRVGAVVACLGALLGLLAGVSRTMLAMARRHDLPSRLSRLDPRHDVPATAQLAVAVAAIALTLVADLRHAIGFSSVGVLLYYAVANAAAWTQDDAHRRWPRLVQAIGLIACVVLVATLPAASVVAGLAVIAAGLGVRALLRHR